MENELGKFIRLGETVTIDTARRIMRILPEAQPEDLVEIPNEDCPPEEALDLRCNSY